MLIFTGTECPLISTGWPVSLSNRPILGPITAAATKAATPPAQCTTPLPAKSFKYKNRSGGYE